MLNSPLFTAFRFPVFFRPSALAAVALLVVITGSIVDGLIVSVVLFVSVLVHELGHSLAFRRYGSESHIVIHMLGGHSAPDRPSALSDSEWVRISAAGPIVALVVLGIPALVAQQYLELTGLAELFALVLIYFNVFWGMLNLVPIWPLDGGRVFYHGASAITGKDQWGATRILTLILSVVVVVISFNLEYRLIGFLAVFNAWQVLNTPGPRALMAGETGTPRTRKTAAPPTPESFGADVLAQAYEWIIARRWDKAEAPLEEMLQHAKHQSAARTAIAWKYLLDDDTPSAIRAMGPTPPPPLMIATTEFVANPEIPVDAVVDALRNLVPGVAMVPALILLQRAGRLEDVCIRLGADPQGHQMVRAIEQIVLHQGLVQEQIAVTSALFALDPLN